MYPSDITYHFTTGTLIPQVSSTFYKPYQRISTVNMKNAKAKDGPRSSQMPSSQIYLTYPTFHMDIFPLITSCECVGTEGSGNKCVSYDGAKTGSQSLGTPAARPGFSFGFRANLADQGCAIHVTRPPPSLLRKLR